MQPPKLTSPFFGALAGCLLAATVAPASYSQSAARVCDPTITTPIVIVSTAQRNAAGAEAQPPLTNSGFLWPDTQIGVIKSGESYVYFGSDGGYHARQRYNGQEYGNNKGGSVVRTIGTLDKPLGTTAPVDVTIDPNPVSTVNPHYDGYTYMGGGPVYQVPPGLPGAGNLLLLYHAEINTKSPVSYSLLALAISSDLGAHWTDIGEIIRFNQPFSESDSPLLEIGDPNLTLSADQNYFYVYFQDWLKDGTVTNVSVARAPVSDVLLSAFGGSVHSAAPFEKYYQGAWSQPALGGLSTDLAPNSPAGGGPQVAWNSALGRYTAISDVSQFLTYAESADGISWTRPTVLHIPSAFNSAYATPVGLGNDPSVLGSEFYVYYTDLPEISWAHATFERFTLSCH
jgi:hypothetical protein